MSVPATAPSIATTASCAMGSTTAVTRRGPRSPTARRVASTLRRDRQAPAADTSTATAATAENTSTDAASDSVFGCVPRRAISDAAKPPMKPQATATRNAPSTWRHGHPAGRRAQAGSSCRLQRLEDLRRAERPPSRSTWPSFSTRTRSASEAASGRGSPSPPSALRVVGDARSMPEPRGRCASPARRWAVGEDHVGPARERAGDGHALLLAARHIRGPALRASFQPHAREHGGPSAPS